MRAASAESPPRITTPVQVVILLEIPRRAREGRPGCAVAVEGGDALEDENDEGDAAPEHVAEQLPPRPGPRFDRVRAEPRLGALMGDCCGCACLASSAESFSSAMRASMVEWNRYSEPLDPRNVHTASARRARLSRCGRRGSPGRPLQPATTGRASQEVRDVAMHGVLAQDERGRDLSVREAHGDEAQHLGLAPAEWRVAVRLDDDRVVEEAGKRWSSR